MTTSPYIQLTDHHGNKFNVGDTGELHLPPFQTVDDFPQQARDIREMELHPDDVIIVGFAKAGTHWTTSILHMLMKGNTDTYPSLSCRDFAFLERDRKDILPPADRPRILVTHLKFHQLPRQVKERQVKLVYLERNPKDTWVSLYNHMSNHPNVIYPGTWDHFFTYMLSTGFWYGHWFDYVLGYERDLDREIAAGHPVFVNSFEELKKNPVGQIEKLDWFLGYNRGRELCEQIAKACNFSTLKTVLEKNNKVDHHQHIFYRKGEVGDWKNWFTVAQNERFDQVYNARMKGSKLRYTFVLA